MKNIRKALEELWALQNELEVAPKEELQWIHAEYADFFRRKWYGRKDLVIATTLPFTLASLETVLERLRKVITITDVMFDLAMSPLREMRQHIIIV